MDEVIKKLTEKKKKLDGYRPLPSALVTNLEEWFKVELTYSSNAIEGNTLTRKETAHVVEKGLTVKGKTLKEHLEAINHAEALDFIKDLTHKKRQEIREHDVLDIHSLILKNIDNENAGRYRSIGVRIAGVPVVLPNPAKVPELIDDYFKWLHADNTDHPVKIAADAHLRLVTIHPLAAGNGRTARLLLNLLLLQQGYTPALIRKEDREAYIDSIGKAQLHNDYTDYYRLIYKSVDRTLDIYFEGLNLQSDSGRALLVGQKQQLRIGELAQESRETVVTIRYWTEEGLLEVAERTAAGYQLFDRTMIERAKEIRRLQKEERLSIVEIRKRFESG